MNITVNEATWVVLMNVYNAVEHTEEGFMQFEPRYVNLHDSHSQFMSCSVAIVVLRESPLGNINCSPLSHKLCLVGVGG